MRLCIDIDGTLCHLRAPGEGYADVAPLPGAAERLRQWRREGHTVILATARHMKTCQGNPGMALARQGATLFDWLARHGFEYDEIWFGKPHADVYIDDNALRFEGDWRALQLPAMSREAALAASRDATPQEAHTGDVA